MKLKELQYWDKFKVISTDDSTAAVIADVDERYPKDIDAPWTVLNTIWACNIWEPGSNTTLITVRNGCHITMSRDTEVELITTEPKN